jgi:GNAT superfamily N-acetyltransferase
MTLHIRKANESDVPSVLRLLAALDSEPDTGLSVDDGIRLLRRMATYPNYAVYVAATEADPGTVVGTFALLVMDNFAHRGAPSAIVEDVCVDASTRGQGIGRAMMAFAMDLARQNGCYKLVLSSNGARTRAHDFYRSLGFAQHGVSFHVDLGR